MSSGEVKNSTIMNNETGIFTSGSSAPTVKLTNIVNNTNYGVYIDGKSTPNLGDKNANKESRNVIYGNSKYDVYNNTANTIWAQRNYWGTMDLDTIRAHIYDYYDNPALGKVIFEPIWSGPTVGTSGPMCAGGLQITDYKFSQIHLVQKLKLDLPYLKRE
ncbi:MAG: DUF1565 domain-containing protein [bacterium]|nr:DUF1565 domain-containing protein [bacterium]